MLGNKKICVASSDLMINAAEGFLLIWTAVMSEGRGGGVGLSFRFCVDLICVVCHFVFSDSSGIRCLQSLFIGPYPLGSTQTSVFGSLLVIKKIFGLSVF